MTETIKSKVADLLCEYEENLRKTISALLANVDQKPICAVHEAINSIDSGYRSLERRLYAFFESPALEVEEQQEVTVQQEATKKEIKRPPLPKISDLTEENRAKLAVQRDKFVSNTRLMALGEIKRFMPDCMKRVYPYSTVYSRFTDSVLKGLEKEGIRTPVSMADFSFSEVKKFALKYNKKMNNPCIKAFAEIYDIKFAPEKTTTLF